MKTTTVGMRAHLDQTVTTLATIWRIARTDGAEFFFTDHDVDILYDGHTYISSSGYNRTAIENNASLSVDNLDIMGIFDSASITEEDIRAGLFDYAEIFISIVNWSNLTQGEIKTRRGRLGEVILTPQGYFRSEMRGMTQNLSQTIGQIYQAECRADLGDSRCRVPVRPDLILRGTIYTVGAYVRVATDNTVVTEISGEPTQDAYEDRIYRCTSAGITNAVQPVYDIGVGNTTTETGLFATGVLTFTGVPSNNQTVTIGGKVYNFRTSLTDVDGYVLIGANATECAQNLAAAINLDSGAGALYATSTTAHPSVEALQVLATVQITALSDGSDGNSIGTTETLSNATFGAGNTTLSGGVNGVSFIAEESWTRAGEVTAVADQSTYEISVSDSRAVNDWFNGGGFTFETGDNLGFTIEVRDWIQSSGTITVFLPAPFPVQVGDKLRVYPGCDKRSVTCNARFSNILNFRGEPFVPGQDEIANYPNAQ